LDGREVLASMLIRVVANAGLAVLLSCPGFGQSAVLPVFEVASIRPNLNGLSAPLDIGPNRFGAMGMSLDVLIQWAYEVRDFQVTGGPDWLKTTRYDVQAKTEKSVSQSELRLMLQTLLADRCHLQLHRATKEFSGYALTIRTDPSCKPRRKVLAAAIFRFARGES